jgi:RNase H-like domain found in reverse transcriptase/Reverse transcriptase (RNA-dependent DNA polymerase)
MTVYMDDIAIHTQQEKGETEDQHIEQHRWLVKEMLTILEEHDLFLNVKKCQFEQKSIKFLGVHVGQGKVEMQDSKVNKVREWKPPRNVQEVRRFLGFTRYYQYFIKGYLLIAKPLIELTKKSTPWGWNNEQQNSFETLKAKMCEKPVLQQPDFDKTFYLQTDMSAYSVGAILSQEGERLAHHKPK